MSQQAPTCPMSRAQVIDTYFMEHRAKLIDIAAFLDRIERSPASASTASGGATSGGGGDDFRVKQLKQAAALLIDGQPNRAKRVLDLFSDPTTEPLESAAGLKGAYGAWPGAK